MSVSKADFLRQKIQNFSAHVELLFKDNPSIKYDLQKLAAMDITLLWHTVQSIVMKKTAEQAIQTLLTRYKVDSNALDKVQLDKFSRYFDMFKEICG